MQIHEIQFTNFRAFESFRMDFDPRATVIVGRNGTGKSTILDGIAIALDAGWLNFSHEFQRRVRRRDGRLVVVERQGIVTAEHVFPIVMNVVANQNGEHIEWSVEHELSGGRTITSSQNTESSRNALYREVSRGAPVLLPVIAHFRTGRLWRDNALRVQDRTWDGPDEFASRTWGYHGALTAGADRKGLQQWMAWREADRVQRLAQAIEEGKDTRDVKSPQLEAVATAAATCLEGAKRFYYSANHRELRIDFENGPPIPFRILSDGQKNIIAVAADIAWRAAQLNPHLGSNVALETPGIVLIDELDLHLHPAWQMRVLDDLMRAFPKVQFIVTTHSPQIMSAAPPNSVRILDAGHAVRRVDRLRGRDTNSILEDVLGVPSRPPHWKKKLEALARLIEEENLDEAERLLKELEQDEFYVDDPALVSARWEIAMARGGDHAQD
jgi:predicted ATP-binding protein involved in virulence